MSGKLIKYPFFAAALVVSFTLVIIINISGCNKLNSSSKKQVLFDLSHSEIFSPESTAEMGLSKFCQHLSENGYKLKINEQPLAINSLRNSELLVLAGPMTDFSEEELQTVTNFVKDGGNLLILVHIAQPVFSLTERFDIQPSLATVCDETDPVENSPQDFYISNFADHPLSANIEKIAVFGSWGLRIREGGSASIIAKTSEKAWADLNQDRVINKGEPQESYGIVAISSFGEGKVVVCADDAILINKFLKIGDNQQFEKNIISWFKNKSI